MFSSKNRKESEMEAPAGSQTHIGAGSVFTGDLEAAGDLRVDGRIVGNIHCKGRVLVGPEGQVNGDIDSQQADILGLVTGKLDIKDLLHLRGKGVINGDIQAGRLQVEPTATFNGKCHTGASVVSLTASEMPGQNEKTG
jgi:cytoskeletal protein CcmA (bactofilin family)